MRKKPALFFLDFDSSSRNRIFDTIMTKRKVTFEGNSNIEDDGHPESKSRRFKVILTLLSSLIIFLFIRTYHFLDQFLDYS